MAPTSFASAAAAAAAGNTANAARAESGADWPRRSNGATQTFRRPSHATTLSGSTNHSTTREGAPAQTQAQAQNSTWAMSQGVYVPPHAQTGRNGSGFEARYSRDQLTQLFRIQQDSGQLAHGLEHVYMDMATGAWGRKDDDAKELRSGVDQCWDREGGILPLSLTEMTDDEREVGPSPLILRHVHVC
ncbi:GYF domain containing protein [Pyrenophora tritici-repentis]|uniref:Uncharacterized protein n=1 Tax=Pyrenophora tritici-repentis TaxID=45151 RepID=A0A834VPB6_9PLEO|nr:GYF domain containing protein [Pyrenophora tritici-repentis]KAF7569934.1 hypothetical protein PtrM4_123490 [Pyrenophora tritici-repentis]KAI1529765.1 GYF domain containing protein [Pyrenophora tritici-repentis]KAI1531850.1 GYF domain containing protein [Pyrenophora tritici-repentis]KAI1541032.1 GYF domain containing protein [Pyrenophora tritici-repentis]